MMSHSADTELYANEPSLLLNLCRDVIDLLDSEEGKAEMVEMEAQLREISKAVEKLEKLKVAVPNALRSEKTRLASALSIQSESVQVLIDLANGLDDILNDLRSRLGNDLESSLAKKTRIRYPSSEKTDTDILRHLIINALQHLGGSAHRNEVLKFMGEQLDGKLLPGDLEWREATQTYAWQDRASLERFYMTKDGIVKTDSPRGVWELTEEHR
jgi:hypothetical protein